MKIAVLGRGKAFGRPIGPRQSEVFRKRADILIQDRERTPFSRGVHANYAQLAG